VCISWSIKCLKVTDVARKILVWKSKRHGLIWEAVTGVEITGMSCDQPYLKCEI